MLLASNCASMKIAGLIAIFGSVALGVTSCSAPKKANAPVALHWLLTSGARKKVFPFTPSVRAPTWQRPSLICKSGKERHKMTSAFVMLLLHDSYEALRTAIQNPVNAFVLGHWKRGLQPSSGQPCRAGSWMSSASNMAPPAP